MDRTTRSASSTGTTPALVGRAAEITRLQELLTAAFTGHAEEPSTAIVCGTAGLGKSALLHAAAVWTRQHGGRIVQTAGAEFETDVTYAALQHLLLPHLDSLVRLSAGHQQTLEVALGGKSGERPPTPLEVGSATLALLGTLEPVLVIVDDLHWLDRSSSRVLGLVARRIGTPPAKRVAMLGAVRSEFDSLLLHGGLPRLDVEPLGDESSLALLQRSATDLSPAVQRTLLHVAGGNPLALLELPKSLDRDQRRGVAALPPVLSIGAQLTASFEGRLKRLPAPTRRLLLLLALDGTGDAETLRASSGRADWNALLVPAENDDLVFHDSASGRVRFRHPMIRSAVVQSATEVQRRAGHAALAGVLVNVADRRAWHLAESLTGPDAAAADALERAALLSLQRGDVTRAVTLLLRAAEASASPESHSRRLGLAAYIGADVAGDIKNVPLLLRIARRSGPLTTAAALPLAVAAAYHLLNGDGDVATAHRILVDALNSAAADDLPRQDLEEAVFTAMLVCHWSARVEYWVPVDDIIKRLGDSATPLLRLTAALYGDPARASLAEGKALDQLIDRLVGKSDPAIALKTGIAAFYADRLRSCRGALRQLVEVADESGAAGAATNARMILAHDAFDAGDWETASQWARTGIQSSQELGFGLLVVPGMYAEGLVAAVRGEDALARDRAHRLLQFGVPRGARMIEYFARRILSLAAAARSDYDEAFRQATAISPVGTIPSHVPIAMTVALDLVEAAVRTGRRAEASIHAAAVAQTPGYALGPRLQLIADGVAALAAPEAEIRDLFDVALSPSRSEHAPFEYARLQLIYGEHLRRQRAIRASRVHLEDALESFAHLGALTWAGRAQAELRASGSTTTAVAPRYSQTSAQALTAQELQVVTLAAEGFTNRQIGERLFMSPRTVGAHLYRAFPKLQVTSRAALRDALSRLRDGKAP
ncbi:LuxR C-terminal-related transcriptional regulator [Streptomyces bobili]|uniref:LuxR C-terminal-related transcriptional regulator n=1 Tax=Streptomyces bobili TaxID=67280 RepID=UPI0037BBC0FD